MRIICTRERGGVMKRFCNFLANVIDAVIIVAVFIVTLPVRILDRIIYGRSY